MGPRGADAGVVRDVIWAAVAPAAGAERGVIGGGNMRRLCRKRCASKPSIWLLLGVATINAGSPGATGVRVEVAAGERIAGDVATGVRAATRAGHETESIPKYVWDRAAVVKARVQNRQRGRVPRWRGQVPDRGGGDGIGCCMGFAWGCGFDGWLVGCCCLVACWAVCLAG